MAPQYSLAYPISLSPSTPSPVDATIVADPGSMAAPSATSITVTVESVITVGAMATVGPVLTKDPVATAKVLAEMEPTTQGAATVPASRLPDGAALPARGSTATGSGPALMLGGVRADVRSAAAVVGVIGRFATGLEQGQLAVSSVNLDHIHHFGLDPHWRRVFAGVSRTGQAMLGLHWLNLIDGVPAVRQAERLSGGPVDKLSGSDLIEPVLDLAARKHLRLAFLGGTSDTHRRLQRRWAGERPDMEVVGWWAPEREELADLAAAERLDQEIRDARVDILVVGLGKPRQEEWIAEHGVQCQARSMLAFGAVVDFLAGNVKRAPVWVSARGLEWAWRLVQEPRRLTRRYLLQGPPAYWRLRSGSYLLPSQEYCP